MQDYAGYMDFITRLEQQELQIAGQIAEGTVGVIALLQLCMSASFLLAATDPKP